MDLNKYLNETAAPETQYSKEEYAAMKKAEREAVWVQVDARMGEVLADAPTLQGFLDFMSQCRNSLPNQLLLSGQNADITDARTFQQWKDAGRHIRTGEEGYTAIVGQVYENNGRKASGYNIGKVFDITQTRGRPVPPPANYQVDELIAAAIESSPVPIQISDSLPDGIQAQYVPKNRTIYVRNGMDAGTTLCAIVRECAQADLGWWAGMRKKEPLLPVLILGLLAFTVLWPLWFTVGGALMASDELTAALGPALLDTADGGYAVWTILPSWPTLQPLAELLLDTPQFFSVFWNTCLLAFAQIAGQLVVAAPASWAFAKLRFAGRRFLLLGYIALMVLPFQVLMVPNYLIATRLGIYDTPLSVILPGVFSAFPVFIMTRSFQDVPNELLEAAKLDGATAWQIFWKIGVPLGYAGIFAALVLNFIEGWNAVEQPLLFLKSQSNWPLSMYMNDIVTDNLGIAMAASLLSLIPAMLVFLYGQTYLELGIQAGGIKA